MNYPRPDDEQRFAEYLQGILREFHSEVPPPPREEMWLAIQEARRGVSARPEVTEVSKSEALPASDKLENKLPRGRWLVPMKWAVPIAAAFLVIGVGVGGYYQQSLKSGAAEVEEASVASAERPVEVAAEHHFTEVEQLIATFASIQSSEASAVNNAILEAEIGIWARNLLSTTQLLMDSPLGLDPQRRKLLTDVEMILVEIAQLAPNPDPDDRELTERSIEQSQIRERLQEVVPAPERGSSGSAGHKGI